MDAKALLIKGSIGLAGVGGIAYAGYQAISSKSETQEKNNVENKLKREGYKLITEVSEHFEAILNNYKTIINNKPELKFHEFAGVNKDNKQAKDILWGHCQSAFNSDVSDEILNKARKWCVEPITVKQLLTNQRLSIIDATANDDGTKAKWDKKVTAYRALTGSSKVFNDLTIGTGSELITDQHRNSIKEKCKEIEVILSHDVKYEDSLNNFKEWCVNKQII